MTQPSDEQLARLARLIAATECEEIDCDEMLSRAAGYLQALRAQEPITDAFRQVAQHLLVCPECREEFLALLQAEGIDPQTLFRAP